MAIIQSVFSRGFEVVLSNKTTVSLPVGGKAEIPDDQIESPHLQNCKRLGMLRIKSEAEVSKAEAPKPTLAKRKTGKKKKKKEDTVPPTDPAPTLSTETPGDAGSTGDE